MRIDTISTFPDMYSSVMGASMMKRAQDKGLLEFHAYDLRDWTHDVHRTTDDEPYGGGAGLVMKCEPIFEAHRAVSALASDEPYTIFLTPLGSPLTDEMTLQLAQKPRLLFVCGHYEGIDERAYELADACISLGDYVLTSGELASMVVIDALVRRIPGVLGASASDKDESFSSGLLEYPQYTRPADFEGRVVPEVLRSGNHQAIAQFRREQSLLRTAQHRFDMLEDAYEAGLLTSADLKFLAQAGYTLNRA